MAAATRHVGLISFLALAPADISALMPVIDNLSAQYALTKKLGQGGFGTVYKAQRCSDRKVGGHSRAFLSIVSPSSSMDIARA
jgi:hypothetical protein